MKEKPKKVKVDENPTVKGAAKKVNCVGVLVQELDRACDQGLASMTRVNWAAVDQVEDQSLYVSQVVQAIMTKVPRLQGCLQTSRKSFRQFCIKFVSTFIPKFISNLYKCKAVGTVGAEQLLRDTHSLKTALLDLPSLVVVGKVQPFGRKAPQAFTKVVVQGMKRAEMILKVVMSPMESARAFVVQYMRLVQSTESTELSKLLDMKGVTPLNIIFSLTCTGAVRLMAVEVVDMVEQYKEVAQFQSLHNMEHSKSRVGLPSW